MRTLSRARVEELVAEIRDCARVARSIDDCDGFSYPAMYGGVRYVLGRLIRDLAGEDAADQVEAALAAASEPMHAINSGGH